MHFGRSGRANELSHHSVVVFSRHAEVATTAEVEAAAEAAAEMAKNVLKAMCGTKRRGAPLTRLVPTTRTHTLMHRYTLTLIGVSVSRAVAKGNSSCSHSHIPYPHIPYTIFPLTLPLPIWGSSIWLIQLASG